MNLICTLGTDVTITCKKKIPTSWSYLQCTSAFAVAVVVDKSARGYFYYRHRTEQDILLLVCTSVRHHNTNIYIQITNKELNNIVTCFHLKIEFTSHVTPITISCVNAALPIDTPAVQCVDGKWPEFFVRQNLDDVAVLSAEFRLDTNLDTGASLTKGRF